MNINELEKSLDEALSDYAYEVQTDLKLYKEMSQADRELYLIETLDEMNRQNYYAMNEFKNNIIEYLKKNN